MDQATVELSVAQEVMSPHEHFIRCIERDELPLTGLADATDTLKVCLAFNRSAETGQAAAV